jgi:hypothetical protein
VIARFESQVIVGTNIKLADKRAQIAKQLSAAFPSSAFELQFERVQL